MVNSYTPVFENFFKVFSDSRSDTDIPNTFDNASTVEIVGFPMPFSSSLMRGYDVPIALAKSFWDMPCELRKLLTFFARMFIATIL